MAFTAEQEEKLVRIIEAFDNGKRLQDLRSADMASPDTIVIEVSEEGESKKAVAAALLGAMAKFNGIGLNGNHTAEDLGLAAISGTYPNLTAGIAQNIASLTTDSVENGDLIFPRSTGGSTTIPEEGITIIKNIKGNGTLSASFNPSGGFLSVGYNQWLGETLNGRMVNGSGAIVANADKKVLIFACIATSAGAGKNNGYKIEWNDSAAHTVGNVAWFATKPSMNASGGSVLAPSGGAYLPALAGWLAVTLNANDTGEFCMSLKWSGDQTGYKNPSSHIVALPLLPWGLGKVGDRADEIVRISDTQVRLIQRTNIVGLDTLIFTMVPPVNPDEQGVQYTFRAAVPDADTVMTAFGSDFNESMTLSGGIVTVTAAYTTIEDFMTALDGKSLHYALATPTESVLTHSMQLANADYGTEWFVASDGGFVNTSPSQSSLLYAPDYRGWVRDMYKNILPIINDVTATALNELDARLKAIEDALDGTVATLTVQDLTVLRSLKTLSADDTLTETIDS